LGSVKTNHLKLLQGCSSVAILVLAEKMVEEGCGPMGLILSAVLVFLLPHPGWADIVVCGSDP